MTLQKALFILRHGSAEGVKAYLEAVKVCEDEINHQKAEIERLNAEVKEKSETIDFLKKQCTDWCDSFCKVKFEAIKEFAERLKAEMHNIPRMEYGSGDIYFLVSETLIDNLVEEMTEGEDER